MTNRPTQLKAFDRLLTIMDELREQCPWDQKQTMETLRPLTIEETYELGDAILDADLNEVKGELGDLLLHIVFYSRIGSETNDFDISDVINGICEKLIYRHPHIYSDVKVKDETEVKQNWENLKLKEGKLSVLQGVPKSLPDYAYTPFGQNSNPTYISEQLELYNSYAQTYCENNNLNYVYITDITQEGLTNTELVASDNLHPSTLAYTRFVQRILPIALEILD